MDVDYEGELPPHRQIADWLLQRIEAGEWRPGQRIASEKDICQEWGVARTTARRAIAYLQKEGIIYTVPGRGSFISPQKGNR